MGKPVRKFCLDCGEAIDLPVDIQEDEVVSCQCCLSEFLIKFFEGGVVLERLETQGEDWGE